MISYSLIFISLLIFLFPKNLIKNDENFIYSLLFFSFSFSHLILGSISLLIVYLNITNFPIIFFSILILLISLMIRKKIIFKLSTILNFITSEFKKTFYKNQKYPFQKILLYTTILITFLIFISSVGPINHPDASDYHVGYPYQYFIRGGFFVDGGLHQGLVGIGDYANLSFIQEKNTWFIRSLQIINLPILILFLSNKVKNNIFLLGLISSPTFIQWSTIGKPLFLGESCLIAIYILWKINKSIYNFKFLIILSIACITFKISSLIIVFPIFLDILFYLKNLNNRNELYSHLSEIFRSKLFIFTCLVLISLLIIREQITGNFAYPLLTNFFNKNEPLVNEFSSFLKNYGREGLFPLNIFLPTSFGEMGQSLGPFIIFTIILSAVKIKNISINFSKNNLLLIGFSQLILLLLFSQGRADYYISPLILFTYLSNQLSLNKNHSLIYNIFCSAILIQLTIITSFTSVSVFQSMNSLQNFNQNMEKTAFGFSTSLIIDKQDKNGILFTNRNTRLYYPNNYIDRDLFLKCINNNYLYSKQNLQNFCLDKYKINQIISNNNFLIENKNFKCDKINIPFGSRNPFNRSNLQQQYCKRENLLK